MIMTFESKHDFSKLKHWLEKSKNPELMDILNKYGELGVEALRQATPEDTGKTASCWTYSVDISTGRAKLSFDNTNENNGVKIAILLQYGHGTRNGGWVEGQDYINPALKPIFDELEHNAWEEIKKL